jgi:hypothetical protein
MLAAALSSYKIFYNPTLKMGAPRISGVCGIGSPIWSSPAGCRMLQRGCSSCGVQILILGWLDSAGWLAFVPPVHFRGRGGGLQRCERFQDFVAVARAFRHDPRVARFQVHDLAFDM